MNPGDLRRSGRPRHRRSAAAWVAALGLTLSPVAGATTIAHEPFEYDLGAFGTPNGGTGFTAGWGNSALGNSVVEGLSFPGIASSGSAVRVTGNDNPDRAFRFVDLEQPANGEQLWIGFLIQFPSANDGFVGISVGNNNTNGAGLGIGATGAGELAFSETRVPGGGVSTGIVPDLDTTYFLAARITFQAGDDIAELFVNPDPSVIPTVPDVVKSDFLVANVSQLNLAAFRSGNAVILDEIRYATSYPGVVSTVVPEPAAALLLSLGLAGLARRQLRRG